MTHVNTQEATFWVVTNPEGLVISSAPRTTKGEAIKDTASSFDEWFSKESSGFKLKKVKLIEVQS